jgi:hypothetical protein
MFHEAGLPLRTKCPESPRKGRGTTQVTRTEATAGRPRGAAPGVRSLVCRRRPAGP